MPCQCGTSPEAEHTRSGCECETTSSRGCGCSDASPAEAKTSLEHVVMELDKRVRRLEATR